MKKEIVKKKIVVVEDNLEDALFEYDAIMKDCEVDAILVAYGTWMGQKVFRESNLKEFCAESYIDDGLEETEIVRCADEIYKKAFFASGQVDKSMVPEGLLDGIDCLLLDGLEGAWRFFAEMVDKDKVYVCSGNGSICEQAREEGYKTCLKGTKCW